MRALVTGAAGFIGSHLCDHLDAAGVEVLAIDREPIRCSRENVTTVVGDLCDPRVSGLAAGCDIVYHLAGQPGVRQSWTGFDRYLADNLLATQTLLDAVRDNPPQRFVYASSSSVYGESQAPPRPVSPYGVTKLAVEHLCTAYRDTFAIPTVGLRYFTVYGPRQRPDMAFARFIAAIRAGEPVDVYGDGEQTRSFTYVDDVVRATILAADAKPDVYDVASRERCSVLDTLALLGELCQREPVIRHLPEAAGDPRHPGRAICRRLPGFTATTSIAEGLASQVQANEPEALAA